MAGESYRIRSRQKNGHHSGLNLVTILGDMKHRHGRFGTRRPVLLTKWQHVLPKEATGFDEDMRS